MALLPTSIEKFIYNGEEILLDRPRFRHFMDGRVVMGYRVDIASRQIANDQTMIPADAIGHHCAMAWNSEDNILEESGGPTWSSE